MYPRLYPIGGSVPMGIVRTGITSILQKSFATALDIKSILSFNGDIEQSKGHGTAQARYRKRLEIRLKIRVDIKNTLCFNKRSRVSHSLDRLR
jgi:hypothetical protein